MLEKEGTTGAMRKKEREGAAPERVAEEKREEKNEKERERERESSGNERERTRGAADRRGKGESRETLLTPPSIQDGVGSGSPRH